MLPADRWTTPGYRRDRRDRAAEQEPQSGHDGRDGHQRDHRGGPGAQRRRHPVRPRRARWLFVHVDDASVPSRSEHRRADVSMRRGVGGDRDLVQAGCWSVARRGRVRRLRARVDADNHRRRRGRPARRDRLRPRRQSTGVGTNGSSRVALVAAGNGTFTAAYTVPARRPGRRALLQRLALDVRPGLSTGPGHQPRLRQLGEVTVPGRGHLVRVIAQESNQSYQVELMRLSEKIHRRPRAPSGSGIVAPA